MQTKSGSRKTDASRTQNTARRPFLDWRLHFPRYALICVTQNATGTNIFHFSLFIKKFMDVSSLIVVVQIFCLGIGVPATAASGAITANTLVSVGEHWKMLDKIRLPQK